MMWPALVTGPAVTRYHLWLVNSSAGKDSQAMLSTLVRLADSVGFPRERIVVVHADLGRVEWEGTLELAREQAAAYGLRFEVVRRSEDLLDQVRTRNRTLKRQAGELAELAAALEEIGQQAEADKLRTKAAAKLAAPAWPSSAARYCTSDQKTNQVQKLMTRLVAELRQAGHEGPVRILNCLGLRAQESPARAKKEPFGRDRATNGLRTVDRWLPIFHWTTDQVWAVIRESGLRWHEAYDAGMPRLSCVFCVLAGERELILATRLNPSLAVKYLEVEQEVGSDFKQGLSMASIINKAGKIAA